MNKKTYDLIFAIVTGVEAIAEGVVTFISPAYMVAINTAIPIAGGAVLAICKLFVKEEKTLEK